MCSVILRVRMTGVTVSRVDRGIEHREGAILPLLQGSLSLLLYALYASMQPIPKRSTLGLPLATRTGRLGKLVRLDEADIQGSSRRLRAEETLYSTGRASHGCGGLQIRATSVDTLDSVHRTPTSRKRSTRPVLSCGVKCLLKPGRGRGRGRHYRVRDGVGE